jgi:hypothetical protein
MIVVNFGHPLTREHLTEVSRLSGENVDRVVEVATQFDNERPFADQVAELIAKAALSTTEWQTLKIVVNLPSLSAIAAVVLAELHGRTGYFPTIVRLRPLPNATPPMFAVAELMDLQRTRNESRERR